MASESNYVTIIGNCTKEPELRFTPSGLAVTNLSIAVNRRWQNKTTQEWEEAVSFFDVTAWQQLAENVAESVQKGTRIIVMGRLDQQSWETDDGQKRSKVAIVADEIAPSLRWSTATVVKNERKGEGVSSGGGRSKSAPQEPPPGYDLDEEPF